MAKLGKALLMLGGLCFAAAVGWWYAFYQQFLGKDVKQASECFYFNSGFCVLGDMASFVGDIPAYQPWAFWASVAIVAVGALVLALAPMRR